MRIGLNTPDSQSVSAEQAKKTSAAATGHSALSPAADQGDWSQDTVTLSALATQALNTPELRQDVVDRLKQSVASGEYQLDPNQIADSILGG